MFSDHAARPRHARILREIVGLPTVASITHPILIHNAQATGPSEDELFVLRLVQGSVVYKVLAVR